MNKKTVEDYLKLPYNIKFQPRFDEGASYYYVKVEELQGCQSHGETLEEAARNIKTAMKLWFEGCLEENWEIPLPDENAEQRSGKFHVRLPKSLHGEVARSAKNEGVSLNQYIVYALAKQIGQGQLKL